jgi:peptidoglycan/xylan/chitin deacetylase (PgdA/CDA1 family)
MKKFIMLALAGYLLLPLCNLPLPTVTASPSISTITLPSVPVAGSSTPTITPTWTPSPVPTATWAHVGPGIVNVPIILYHHVGFPQGTNRFYVTEEQFEGQMRLLSERGYIAISTRTLVEAVTRGADLPDRPIIITFDDGNLDTYTSAFPIMQMYGFSGVLYVVGSYMGADQYMSVDQVKELAAAGWEIGSHGMTHSDLTLLDPEKVRYEVTSSKKYLEKTLELPVDTIAYPFGNSTVHINDHAYAAGYIAGMSLGNSSSHGAGNLFVLQRLDVKGEYDLDQFESLLPSFADVAP